MPRCSPMIMWWRILSSRKAAEVSRPSISLLSMPQSSSASLAAWTCSSIELVPVRRPTGVSPTPAMAAMRELSILGVHQPLVLLAQTLDARAHGLAGAQVYRLGLDPQADARRRARGDDVPGM